MKLASVFKEKRVVFSFEVFPPKKSAPIETIYQTLEGLAPLNPDFISVTYGAGGSQTGNVTLDIASLIQDKYKIPALAHLTCLNSTRQQVNATLGALKAAGIENVLALRGDKNPDLPPQTDFLHADALIAAISAFDDFHIAAACYPEGHPQSASLEEDVDNLKRKLDAGASHLISQLFFDNADFYRFVDLARKKGINAPIEAGIMPVINGRQIQRMVSLCGASLPPRFAKMINRYGHSPEALRDAGIAYAAEQIIDLVANAAQGIHLYTMNNPPVAEKICGSVANIIACENRRDG